MPRLVATRQASSSRTLPSRRTMEKQGAPAPVLLTPLARDRDALHHPRPSPSPPSSARPRSSAARYGSRSGGPRRARSSCRGVAGCALGPERRDHALWTRRDPGIPGGPPDAHWFTAMAQAVGGSISARAATWGLLPGRGGVAQGGVIGNQAGFAITGDFHPRAHLRRARAGSHPLHPDHRGVPGQLPQELGREAGPRPRPPRARACAHRPTLTRDPGAYPPGAAWTTRGWCCGPPPSSTSTPTTRTRRSSPGRALPRTTRSSSWTPATRSGVAAALFDPDRLRVQVPAGIQSGFARVRRGALRSNPQTFNAPAS
jgi:hypothetical protein